MSQFDDNAMIQRMEEKYSNNDLQLSAMKGMYAFFREIGQDPVTSYVATIVECLQVLKEIRVKNENS